MSLGLTLHLLYGKLLILLALSPQSWDHRLVAPTSAVLPLSEEMSVTILSNLVVTYLSTSVSTEGLLCWCWGPNPGLCAW